MEAVRTSETSVDNNFTRQYIPEDNSEHHTRRRENLKSHKTIMTYEQSPLPMPRLSLSFVAYLWFCSLFKDAFSERQIICRRIK
jgi:hypothetical protein